MVGRYLRSQGGFTLIEVIIASAISLIVMTGMTSLVLTTLRANDTASSRIQASSQIRNFELQAYDDFARSLIPNGSGCPCTTSPIVLQGLQVANSTTPVPVSYSVTYTWDSSLHNLDRRVGADPTRHSATDVTAFSWFTTGNTVVVNLTVTIVFGSFQTYSESQTLRFYPRLNP